MELPAGAYATDIPPFTTSFAQRTLADKLYYNPMRADTQDVSWCVVLQDDGEFEHVADYQYVKRATAGSWVDVHVLDVVPNMMDDH